MIFPYVLTCVAVHSVKAYMSLSLLLHDVQHIIVFYTYIFLCVCSLMMILQGLKHVGVCNFQF